MAQAIRKPSRLFGTKWGGHKAWTSAEEEKLERDPRIVAAREQKDAVARKYNDILELNENDRLLVLITRTDEEAEQSLRSPDSKLSESGQKRIERQKKGLRQLRVQERVKWEKKWELECDQIRRNPDLTDEQKQSEMNRVMEARSAQIRRGRALNERQNQYGREEERAAQELQKARRAVYGADLKGAAYQAEEKKYLEGRSPSYNKMFKAVDNYVRKVGANECTVKDGMDAVCSILEYQDGKEAKGGSLRERVNLSMKTLAQITVGTDAEYLLDQQIEKINAARGLRPGQKGALSKDSLIERAPEAENSLYDRIRNLQFGNGPEADAEEIEAEPERNAEPKKEDKPADREHAKEGEEYESLLI